MEASDFESQSNYNPLNSFIPASSIEGLDPTDKSEYQWNGWCRSNGNSQKTMPQQWPSSEWRVVFVKVNGFTETNHKTGERVEFRGRRLAAIVNQRTKELKIITRASKTPEEKAVHNRMPSRPMKDWDLKKYIEELNKFTEGSY